MATLARLIMNHGISLSKLRRPLFLALLSLATVACDDDLNQDWVAVPDTVLLYSLSRPDLIGRPSALDFVLGVLPVEVENPVATNRWDIAITDQGAGMAMVPASAFTGLNSRAAIATVSASTLEAVDVAPGDSASYSRSPVQAELGKFYVVRSRRETCGFGAAGSYYVKLEILEVNRTAGTLRMRVIRNPYCNDRKLIPPD